MVPGPVWLALKTTVWLSLFIFVRACLPRYRYDGLMVLGWKVLLPFSLAWFYSVLLLWLALLHGQYWFRTELLCKLRAV
jgi:NADH:ubiquinone oxidoreductase subunit H